MNTFDTLRTVGRFMSDNVKTMDRTAVKIAKGEGDLVANVMDMKKANVNVKVGTRLIKMIDEMNKTVIELGDIEKNNK